MGKESKAKKPHVYIIPYPAQGHINPALAFAKSLTSKGLQITFITTTNLRNTAKFSEFNSNITITNISDGAEELTEPETVEGYFRRFKAVYSQNLSNFIDEQISSGCCGKLIMYDSIMPWVLDIAHEKGLLGASFFTMAAAVSALFYHVKQGLINLPSPARVSLPSLPPLEMTDLPHFYHLAEEGRPTVVRLIAHQFSNVERADFVFFNTFHKLEKEILEWMAIRWPIITVGPTFLLQQKDEESPEDKAHLINLFEPKHGACREWLDSKENGSVIYVSFGSISSLGKEQMEELAFGLLMSNCYFLWVVRSSEVDKLPHDFTSEKGLIVEWCHQPEVLAHRATACFMTHCGWNSTLEALSYGVPLVAMAQWADQITNSKFIEDVWGVGVRVKLGENGIVGREEIAICIREIIEGEKGIQIKKNACKWKELGNEAVQKGGTSATNVDDFVSKLLR